jgi:putative transcriptional regulator
MSNEITSEVRKLRFLNGEMTQEDLARKVGVSRQTIVAIERGRYDPSVSLAIRIARVFAVPVEEVFILHQGEDQGSSLKARKGRNPR